MSDFFDPYNADRPLMMKCSCGRDHTLADHHAEANADAAAATLRARSETADFEAYSNAFILFPAVATSKAAAKLDWEPVSTPSQGSPNG